MLFQIWVSVSWISDNWIDYLVTQIKSELTLGKVCVYEAGGVIGCVKLRTKWKNRSGPAHSWQAAAVPGPPFLLS